MQKKIKRNIFGFILGALIISLTTVYATTIFQASNLPVDTTNMPNVGSNKTVQDTIEYLYSKPYCPNGYECQKKRIKLKLGDYVQMTPTLTSYTIDRTYTGYTGSATQTINPSELNLWRVIQINSDGTIDMVSEYVSSTAVYFSGKVGYKNLVGYLNILASKYENSNYTVDSRQMGYNGQTEYLTDTDDTVDSSSKPYWYYTQTNSKESIGLGDILHTQDTKTVEYVLGTFLANQVGTNSAAGYWLASRYYTGNNSSTSLNWQFSARVIPNDKDSDSYTHALYYHNSDGFSSNSLSYHLRPIVTLKSDILILEGSGTSSAPWVLS